MKWSLKFKIYEKTLRWSTLTHGSIFAWGLFTKQRRIEKRVDLCKLNWQVQGIKIGVHNIFQRFVIFPQCVEKVVGRHDFVIPHMMAFVLLHLVMPDNFHFPSNSLAFPRKAKLKVTFHLAQLRNWISFSCSIFSVFILFENYQKIVSFEFWHFPPIFVL